MKKKIVFLPYDFDTSCGISNEGALVFSYNLEDVDQTEGGADVYNGQQSVFWKNIREMYFDEIKSMYQDLRSKNRISYGDTEQRFEDHQSKWSEAIFNEDSQFKYLDPLIEENSSAYLSMLQGSKAEQRKWWMYNRFRYLDSKYNAGDAESDVITLRGYAKSDITVTPYADIYATIKYGSYLEQVRAERNKSYTLPCRLDNVNDSEIYIFSASQLKSIGDISGLKVGYAEFSMGTKLQDLKIGDASPSYSNGNLTELYLGENRLLKTLDVRNCPNLTQNVDISGCTNIEEVYFEGTAVRGVQLPVGGILKTLHLPGSIANLTIRNQPSLTDLSVESYENVSTLWLDNVGPGADMIQILHSIPEGARVRIIGIDLEMSGADEIDELYAVLDTMRGLDDHGNNMDSAQVSGRIHTAALTGAKIAEYLSKYPYIEIVADESLSYRTYANWDGSVIKVVECINGVPREGAPTGVTRPDSPDGHYSYAFIGWNTVADSQTVDPYALQNVLYDRTIYAAYTWTVKKYTVRWVNMKGTVLEVDENVPWGTMPTYNGRTPVYDGSIDDGYTDFTGWNPAVSSVVGDITYTATYKYSNITIDLVSRQIKKFENDTLTSTRKEAFMGCDNLTSVHATALINIGEYSFYGLRALKTVYAPSVTTIGHAAFLCSHNTYRTSGLTSAITPSVVDIGDSAFYVCERLEDVDIHNAKNIGRSAFYSCVKIKSVDLSNTEIIGNEAFSECNSLASTGVINAQTLGEYAFSKCSSLTSVECLASIIGGGAFRNCTSLESITLPNVSEIGDLAFAGDNALKTIVIGTADSDTVCLYKCTSSANDPQNEDLKIYVAPGLVDVYKTASNWSRLADKIVAIGA